MDKLEAGTKDASLEKHVPVVEAVDGGIMVKVGSVAHPMEEKHYIRFIEVLTKDQVLRAELAPNQAPEASFLLKSDDVVEVREYCNLHGLWKASN
jgi:superoxide reductase